MPLKVTSITFNLIRSPQSQATSHATVGWNFFTVARLYSDAVVMIPLQINVKLIMNYAAKSNWLHK